MNAYDAEPVMAAWAHAGWSASRLSPPAEDAPHNSERCCALLLRLLRDVMAFIQHQQQTPNGSSLWIDAVRGVCQARLERLQRASVDVDIEDTWASGISAANANASPREVVAEAMVQELLVSVASVRLADTEAMVLEEVENVETLRCLQAPLQREEQMLRRIVRDGAGEDAQLRELQRMLRDGFLQSLAQSRAQGMADALHQEASLQFAWETIQDQKQEIVRLRAKNDELTEMVAALDPRDSIHHLQHQLACHPDNQLRRLHDQVTQLEATLLPGAGGSRLHTTSGLGMTVNSSMDDSSLDRSTNRGSRLLPSHLTSSTSGTECQQCRRHARSMLEIQSEVKQLRAQSTADEDALVQAKKEQDHLKREHEALTTALLTAKHTQEELRKMIASLSDEKQQLQSQQEMQQRQGSKAVDALKTQLQDLEKAWREQVTGQRQTDKARLDVLEKELHNAKSLCVDTMTQKDTLEEKLAGLTRDYEAIQLTATVDMTRAVEAQQALVAADRELLQVKQELADTKAAIQLHDESGHTREQQHHQEIAVIRTQSKATEVALATLRQNHSSLSTELEVYKSRFANAHRELERCTESLSVTSAKVAASEARVKSLQEDLVDCRREVQMRQQAIAESDGRLNLSEEERSMQAKELERVRTRFQQVETAQATQMQLLQQQYEECHRLERLLAEDQEETTHAREQVLQQQDAIEKKEREWAEERKALAHADELSQELSETKTTILMWMSKYHFVVNERESLREQLVRHVNHSERHDLQQEKARLSEELIHAKDQIKRLTDKAKASSLVTRTQEASMKRAQDDLDRLTRELEQKTRATERLEIESTDRLVEIGVLQADKNLLSKQVAAAAEERRVLLVQLAKAQDEVDQRSQELNAAMHNEQATEKNLIKMLCAYEAHHRSEIEGFRRSVSTRLKPMAQRLLSVHAMITTNAGATPIAARRVLSTTMGCRVDIQSVAVKAVQCQTEGANPDAIDGVGETPQETFEPNKSAKLDISANASARAGLDTCKVSARPHPFSTAESIEPRGDHHSNSSHLGLQHTMRSTRPSPPTDAARAYDQQPSPPANNVDRDINVQPVSSALTIPATDARVILSEFDDAWTVFNYRVCDALDAMTERLDNSANRLQQIATHPRRRSAFKPSSPRCEVYVAAENRAIDDALVDTGVQVSFDYKPGTTHSTDTMGRQAHVASQVTCMAQQRAVSCQTDGSQSAIAQTQTQTPTPSVVPRATQAHDAEFHTRHDTITRTQEANVQTLSVQVKSTAAQTVLEVPRHSRLSQTQTGLVDEALGENKPEVHSTVLREVGSSGTGAVHCANAVASLASVQEALGLGYAEDSTLQPDMHSRRVSSQPEGSKLFVAALVPDTHTAQVKRWQKANSSPVLDDARRSQADDRVDSSTLSLLSVPTTEWTAEVNNCPLTWTDTLEQSLCDVFVPPVVTDGRGSDQHQVVGQRTCVHRNNQRQEPSQHSLKELLAAISQQFAKAQAQSLGQWRSIERALDRLETRFNQAANEVVWMVDERRRLLTTQSRSRCHLEPTSDTTCDSASIKRGVELRSTADAQVSVATTRESESDASTKINAVRDTSLLQRRFDRSSRRRGTQRCVSELVTCTAELPGVLIVQFPVHPVHKRRHHGIMSTTGMSPSTNQSVEDWVALRWVRMTLQLLHRHSKSIGKPLLQSIVRSQQQQFQITRRFAALVIKLLLRHQRTTGWGILVSQVATTKARTHAHVKHLNLERVLYRWQRLVRVLLLKNRCWKRIQALLSPLCSLDENERIVGRWHRLCHRLQQHQAQRVAKTWLITQLKITCRRALSDQLRIHFTAWREHVTRGIMQRRLGTTMTPQVSPLRHTTNITARESASLNIAVRQCMTLLRSCIDPPVEDDPERTLPLHRSSLSCAIPSELSASSDDIETLVKLLIECCRLVTQWKQVTADKLQEIHVRAAQLHRLETHCHELQLIVDEYRQLHQHQRHQRQANAVANQQDPVLNMRMNLEITERHHEQWRRLETERKRLNQGNILMLERVIKQLEVAKRERVTLFKRLQGKSTALERTRRLYQVMYTENMLLRAFFQWRLHTIRHEEAQTAIQY